MRRIHYIFIIVSIIVPMRMMAQAGNDDGKPISASGVSVTDNVTDMPPAAECSLPLDALPQPFARDAYFGRKDDGLPTDSLHLPLMNALGSAPLINFMNESWWGMDMWRLHRGLNVNLGTSVFASFGKGAPKGAGFGQDLSLMYAVPLTNRLSLAVGGWVSNVYWAHDRFTDAGVSAVLGYKFDDHWEAYVYGRKSILNKPMPYKFATMGELGDRIGAAVKYNFSPSFSLQVSVSAGRSEWHESSSGDFNRSAVGTPQWP